MPGWKSILVMAVVALVVVWAVNKTTFLNFAK